MVGRNGNEFKMWGVMMTGNVQVRHSQYITQIRNARVGVQMIQNAGVGSGSDTNPDSRK